MLVLTGGEVCFFRANAGSSARILGDELWVAGHWLRRRQGLAPAYLSHFGVSASPCMKILRDMSVTVVNDYEAALCIFKINH